MKPRRKASGIWLRASEAAAILGIDRTTLWRWQQGGSIPASAQLGVGSRTRFHRAWCESGLVPDPAQLIPRRVGPTAA